ncbi:MAG: energy transducer TonB [Bacteroidota bacterium]
MLKVNNVVPIFPTGRRSAGKLQRRLAPVSSIGKQKTMNNLIKMSLSLILMLFLFNCTNTESIIFTDDAAYYFNDTVSTSYIKYISEKKDDGTIGVEKPVITHQEKVSYPIIAQRYNIAGKVLVKMNITKNGNVKRAFIIKSPDLVFNKPILESVMEWKFTPAISNGQPIDCWIVVPIIFHFKHH